MCPRHDLSFCACTTVCLVSEILVSICSRPHLWFLHAKQQVLVQNYQSLWVPGFICGFWLQNSVFWYRIISLYRSQTSPVALCTQNIVSGTWITSICGFQTSPAVLCMQNSVCSIRITILYWSQPSTVVFGCIRVTFVPGQQVSMCQRHQLSFCACTTGCLVSEILVSICSRPHLWFLHAKQQVLVQNYQSLWVPGLICGFWLQNSVFWYRIKSLCRTQTSPVVFAYKTACLASEILVSIGTSPHLWILDAKQRLLDQNNKSLWVPDIICGFEHT